MILETYDFELETKDESDYEDAFYYEALSKFSDELEDRLLLCHKFVCGIFNIPKDEKDLVLEVHDEPIPGYVSISISRLDNLTLEGYDKGVYGQTIVLEQEVKYEIRKLAKKHKLSKLYVRARRADKCET